MGKKKPAFTAVPDDEVRELFIPVRVNRKEKDEITHAAKIRNLSASEFMRRAGLGRKADVRFETEIVLAIREMVKATRELHAAFSRHGLAPPEPLMRQVLLESIAAIQRVAK